VLPEGSQMIATDVASPFVTPVRPRSSSRCSSRCRRAVSDLAVRGAGLYKREKKFAIPLLVSSIVLFYTGIAFAYFVVFRLMFSFFAKVVPGGVTMAPDISFVPELRARHFLAFGLASRCRSRRSCWSGAGSCR